MAVTLETATVRETISLRYLFFTFLKIGTVSFGGHMALISVIQREMAEKDKTISAEAILDAVGIASLLPGPMAVNVVTYLGYHLKGKSGALVSMLGILLPACTLMLVLSWAYFAYSFTSEGVGSMYFVPATVAAIILSTGAQMYQKEVGIKSLKLVLCLTTILLLLFFKSYFLTVLLLLAGGIAGVLLKLGTEKKTQTGSMAGFSLKPGKAAGWTLALLALIEVSFVANVARYFENIYIKISLIFSGISLSLFGGGYVMIPIMQALFVDDLKWLLKQEFVDAIAFSQITPGPILVSATFIGYKLAGVGGALLATAAIFIPSAIVMIVISGIFEKNKHRQFLQNLLSGIKAVVVGMILVAGVNIAQGFAGDYLLVGVTVIVFVLSYRLKVSPVYLILLSILSGISFYSWQ
ncbi:chromate efflux transporter [Dyadobacter sp. CY312]|uniref:chromate efflux transporter n=1 Tax=Dyadobacter sp. CY312 TaxID=2907303 RepID=UPI001F206755|nr:chromate efflux transporter [Dyadobacter sp. CY312]MCE7038956.1 chromate efflux transporter [Dyadobacter sp. CY312]